MADIFEIAGRINSTSRERVVTTADQILAEEQSGIKQSDVNAQHDAAIADRYTKEETYNKSELNNMITTPDVEYITVTATEQTASATDVLPPTGSADAVYRIGCWDGEQYDANSYSEYAWDGTSYVLLDVKNVGIDSIPTSESENLVTSGGVYSALTKKLDIISIELSDSVPGMIELNYMADSADMSSSHIDEETGIIEMIYNVR